MPSKFCENGYFSEDAQSSSATIKHKNKQLFFYLSEVNEQAHRFLTRVKAHSQNLNELFAAALFVRGLTAYQALMLLAEKGFASEIRSTCRCIIDVKFKLAYLLKEPEAALVMLAQHEKQRSKRLRSMKSGDLPVHPDFKQQNWDLVITESETHQKDSKGQKIKIPTISDIAIMCGLQIDYGIYSFLSEATHAGIRDLETYLKFNTKGDAVEGILYGPRDDWWISFVTLEATHFLLGCIELTAVILGIDKSHEFQTFIKKRDKRQIEMRDRYRELVVNEIKKEKR
jgi:hypothetical protein